MDAPRRTASSRVVRWYPTRHALGSGTDAGQLWMDAIAAACTIAVVTALTWRVGDHRTTREEAVAVGASTRAVPGRHRPVARPMADDGHRDVHGRGGADPARRTSASAPTNTATRLLERDPR